MYIRRAHARGSGPDVLGVSSAHRRPKAAMNSAITGKGPRSSAGNCPGLVMRRRAMGQPKRGPYKQQNSSGAAGPFPGQKPQSKMAPEQGTAQGGSKAGTGTSRAQRQATKNIQPDQQRDPFSSRSGTWIMNSLVSPYRCPYPLVYTGTLQSL